MLKRRQRQLSSKTEKKGQRKYRSVWQHRDGEWSIVDKGQQIAIAFEHQLPCELMKSTSSGIWEVGNGSGKRNLQQVEA